MAASRANTARYPRAAARADGAAARMPWSERFARRSRMDRTRHSAMQSASAREVSRKIVWGTDVGGCQARGRGHDYPSSSDFHMSPREAQRPRGPFASAILDRPHLMAVRVDGLAPKARPNRFVRCVQVSFPVRFGLEGPVRRRGTPEQEICRRPGTSGRVPTTKRQGRDSLGHKRVADQHQEEEFR